MPLVTEKMGESKDQNSASMSKTTETARSKGVRSAQSTSAETLTHLLPPSTRAGYTSRITRDGKSRHRRTVAILITISTLLALVVLGLVTYKVSQGRKANQLRKSAAAITTQGDNTDATMPGKDQTPNIEPVPSVPDHGSPTAQRFHPGVGPNNGTDDSVDKTPVESSYMGVPGKLWSFVKRNKMNLGVALGAVAVAAGAYQYMVTPVISAPSPSLARVPLAPDSAVNQRDAWKDDESSIPDAPARAPSDFVPASGNTLSPGNFALPANGITLTPDSITPHPADSCWKRAVDYETEIPYVPEVKSWRAGPLYNLSAVPPRRRMVAGVERTDLRGMQAQVVVGEVWPRKSDPGAWKNPVDISMPNFVGGSALMKRRARRFCNMWKRRNSMLVTDYRLGEYYIHYPTTYFESGWRYGGTNRVKYAGTSTVVNHLDDWVWGNYEYTGQQIKPSSFVRALKKFAKENGWPTSIRYNNGEIDMDKPTCRPYESCEKPIDPVEKFESPDDCYDWSDQPVLTFEIFYMPRLPANASHTPMRNGRPWRRY